MTTIVPRYAVLIGGFSGDGGADHALFDLENLLGSRIPLFATREVALAWAVEHGVAHHGFIAELSMEIRPATQVTDCRSGVTTLVTSAHDAVEKLGDVE